MSKDKAIKQALDGMFQPDEKKQESISNLLGRMTGNLPIEERIVRFKIILRECRDESTELMRILTEMGEPSGINFLSIRESLEESMRFSEQIILRRERKDPQG